MCTPLAVFRIKAGDGVIENTITNANLASYSFHDSWSPTHKISLGGNENGIESYLRIYQWDYGISFTAYGKTHTAVNTIDLSTLWLTYLAFYRMWCLLRRL